LSVAVALACVGAGGTAFAEKLDKDAKKWLDEVKPIMLADEEKTFRELDKSEREEFQKIFWARRDTDLETPANEFRAEYDKTRADVDTRYRVSGRAGSATDCGRVYILLGAPDEVKREPGTGGGSRTPETWIYRDRPGGMKFKDGQAQIMFDSECQLPQGARLGEQLNRVAESKIANPNIDYRTGGDGRLVKAADQLPKPSPGTALLKAPRQDFPATAQNKMFLRSPGGGGSYLAGLLRGDASGLTVQDSSGKKTVKVLVATQAVDDSGKATGVTEHEVVAEVGPDNSFVTSYGLASKPGSYTLNVAVLDSAGQKGTVVSVPLQMPDFGTDELAVSDIMILEDVQEGVTVSPTDPYWAFSMGNTRLLPHFDNVFRPSDSAMLLGVLYNAKTAEPAAGAAASSPDAPAPPAKASVTVGFTISKEGKVVAQAQDQSYDTPAATPGVGPVPLAKYTPGKYRVRMKVRDALAQKDYTKEAEFEIK
jgi:GWxTD domain-containing protein